MKREELIEKINKAKFKIDDDNAFWEIMSGVIDGGFITEQGLANELCTSVPTVKRWKAKKSAPGDSLRLPIYKFLVKFLSSIKK